jgi:hypothetical protein
MTATAKKVPLLKNSLLELAQKHKIWEFFDFGTPGDEMPIEDNILD